MHAQYFLSQTIKGTGKYSCLVPRRLPFDENVVKRTIDQKTLQGLLEL